MDTSNDEEKKTELQVQTSVVVYQHGDQLTELNQQNPEQAVKVIKSDDSNLQIGDPIKQTTQ